MRRRTDPAPDFKADPPTDACPTGLATRGSARGAEQLAPSMPRQTWSSWSTWVASAAVTLGFALPVCAQNEPPDNATQQDAFGNLFDEPANGLGVMDGMVADSMPFENQSGQDDALPDDLLLFMDLPIVVTASRTGGAINKTAQPITILTAEQIHEGGFANLPEALSFTLGVDVVQLDNNRYAVGVRGMNEYYSDRTLVLLDGRSVEMPNYGGVDWLTLPVFLEDLEQIEVARGPGGAAWGANAYNGVINLITKAPEDTTGWLASTRLTEAGSVDSHIRYGAAGAHWAVRVSGGMENVRHTADLNGNNNIRKDDDRIGGKATIDLANQVDANTRWTMGMAYGQQRRGTHLFSTTPTADMNSEMVRLYTKLEKKNPGGNAWHLQWFGQFEDRSDRPYGGQGDFAINELDTQWTQKDAGGHKWTLGANIRQAAIWQGNAAVNEIRADGGHVDDWTGGMFVMHERHLSPRDQLQVQLRGDYNIDMGFDWSGRAAWLHSLDSDDRHVLRVAAARAYRMPVGFIRDPTLYAFPLPTPPFPADSYALEFTNQPGLENESTWSAEVGYTGQPAPNWLWSADGYFQINDNMIGTEYQTVGLQTVGNFANQDRATAHGIETQFGFDNGQSKVGLWYAYRSFELDNDNDIRSMLPSRHAVGLQARQRFGDDWSVIANYRFNAATEHSINQLAPKVPNHHRLDIGLSKTFADGQGEWTLGVRDVLDEVDYSVGSLSDTNGVHAAGGRTFFGRLQWKF